MPVRVATSQAQQAVTVNALIQDPLLLAERIIQVLEGQFAMDRVLRNAGRVTGGAIRFRKATGLFAEQSSEIVAPGGEIPLATRQRGDLDSKPVAKRGLAVEIDREMRLRNAVGEVDAQITTVRNTIVRDIDGEFVSTLRENVPAANVRAATAVWSGATATIRKDINAVRLAIQQFQAAGTSQGFSGYSGGTHMLMSPVTATEITNSDEASKMIFGTTAPTADFYAQGLGEWSINMLGLRPFITPGVADNEVFIVERETVGAYGDEIPLESTELYYFEPRQVYRSDTVRSTAGVIDNPGASGRITGK